MNIAQVLAIIFGVILALILIYPIMTEMKSDSVKYTTVNKDG